MRLISAGSLVRAQSGPHVISDFRLAHAANTTQIAKPTTAPEVSIITSRSDAERDAINDWWNSSVAPKIVQTTQTPANNVDIFARMLVPLRSARQRKAARTAYSIR